MKLPEKAFLTKECLLFESNFECNKQIKPLSTMQFLQDAATDHAQILGVGWDTLDENGILWVLSKIKIVFDVPITRAIRRFVLYTWPLAPNRFFAERCFCAVQDGKQLFSATSMWMLISRDQRKILPAETMNNFYHGEYSAIHSDASATFARVRLDESFSFAYTKTVRRSDLDLNGHVNNTNYITYAVDVLHPNEEICEVEIVFNKELKLGDNVEIFSKREKDVVTVVGVRDETCFTVVMKTR